MFLTFLNQNAQNLISFRIGITVFLKETFHELSILSYRGYLNLKNIIQKMIFSAKVLQKIPIPSCKNLGNCLYKGTKLKII